MHARCFAALAVVLITTRAHAQIPLAGLERQLDPERFVRIHDPRLRHSIGSSSCTPHRTAISTCGCADGTRLTLSRSWRERVERALGRPL